MRNVMCSACVLIATLLTASSARGAELRVLASNGIKAAMEALGPQFEKASGETLSLDYSTAATLKDRIDKGETFDVAVLTDEVVDALIKSGALVASSRVAVARVGIGVGFRKGAPKPDVRTAAALKASLLNASSIAFTGNGASRPYIDKMFATLGIVREMEAKSHLVGPGEAPGSVGKGESTLVLTLISEILPEPGVELAGPLPSGLQSYLGFSAAAAAKGNAAKASRTLIEFFHGGAAIATYKAKGMEPR